jgi:flagellar motor component MotA
MRERPGFVVAGLLWLIKMIKYNAEIGCELSSAFRKTLMGIIFPEHTRSTDIQDSAR